MCSGTQPIACLISNMWVVTVKYYTHFVTAAEKARMSSEWAGVVELTAPMDGRGSASRELRALLADSFDVSTEDIRILHWARLH